MKNFCDFNIEKYNLDNLNYLIDINQTPHYWNYFYNSIHNKIITFLNKYNCNAHIITCFGQTIFPSIQLFGDKGMLEMKVMYIDEDNISTGHSIVLVWCNNCIYLMDSYGILKDNKTIVKLFEKKLKEVNPKFGFKYFAYGKDCNKDGNCTIYSLYTMSVVKIFNYDIEKTMLHLSRLDVIDFSRIIISKFMGLQ